MYSRLVLSERRSVFKPKNLECSRAERKVFFRRSKRARDLASCYDGPGSL